MKTKTLFAAAVATLLNSCGTYTYQESTARYVEPLRAGFVTPVTADMEVSQDKITNTVEIEVEIKKKEMAAIMRADLQGRESALVLGWKKYALAQTLKKYKADDIVSPTYEITPSKIRSGVLEITVTGHPAVYKNYRPATQADVNLIMPFVEQKKDIDVHGGVILQHIK